MDTTSDWEEMTAEQRCELRDRVLRKNPGAVAKRLGMVTYMGGWGDEAALDRVVHLICDRTGLTHLELPDGLRCRDTGAERIWVNYASQPQTGPDGEVEAAGVLRVPAG